MDTPNHADPPDRRDVSHRPNGGRRAAGWSISLGGWMAIIAAISIVVGAARVSIGLAATLAYATVPPLALTAMRASARRARGQPMSGEEKVDFFFGTSATLLVLLPVVALASFLIALASFVIAMMTLRLIFGSQHAYDPLSVALVSGLGGGLLGLIVVTRFLFIRLRELMERGETSRS